jgi:ribosomal protein S18 acetylase RimI-like enzyme
MEAQRLTFRFLVADDARQYSNIRLESLESEPEAFGSSAEEHRRLTEDEVAKRLAGDLANNFVVGAFAGERLVGTAGFFRNLGLKERHKGRVWGVYVTPQQRGTGVGRKMMQLLLERAMGVEGIEQILISVVTVQAAALSLYRSLGFESYGRERRALKIGDRYLDEEHMILFVGQRSTEDAA